MRRLNVVPQEESEEIEIPEALFSLGLAEKLAVLIEDLAFRRVSGKIGLAVEFARLLSARALQRKGAAVADVVAGGVVVGGAGGVELHALGIGDGEAVLWPMELTEGPEMVSKWPELQTTCSCCFFFAAAPSAVTEGRGTRQKRRVLREGIFWKSLAIY